MDNLTHGLVGAALARAGLDRHTPLATTTLVVAANAPDVDMLAFLAGEYAALAFRRGLTHGLPAMAILPFAVAGAVLAWDRAIRLRRDPDAAPARPGGVLLLSVVGLLTHPVLDWMNTYGMRWWVPFDGSWSYGDALFIIDPWLWLGLGGAVALTGRRRPAALAGWGLLAGAATALVLWAPVPAGARAVWLAGLAVIVGLWLRGGRRDPRPDGRPRRSTGTGAGARGALAAAAGYVALMVLADRLARSDVLDEVAAAGLGPVETVMVAPLPADPLGGDVLVRTTTGYVPGSHRWLRSPRVVLRVDSARAVLSWGEGVDPERARAAREAAWQAPVAAHFRVWSRFPLVRVEERPGGLRVRISDMRYDGRGAGSLEGLTVRLDPRLRIVGTSPP